MFALYWVYGYLSDVTSESMSEGVAKEVRRCVEVVCNNSSRKNILLVYFATFAILTTLLQGIKQQTTTVSLSPSTPNYRKLRSKEDIVKEKISKAAPR